MKKFTKPANPCGQKYTYMSTFVSTLYTFFVCLKVLIYQGFNDFVQILVNFQMYINIFKKSPHYCTYYCTKK